MTTTFTNHQINVAIGFGVLLIVVFAIALFNRRF